MNLAKLLDCVVLCAAAGGLFGMLCELASLVWEFYYVHLAAGLCFAAGSLGGIGYALYRRADMRRAAMRLDSFGLKERMITAYEMMDQEDGFACLQRQDALVRYNQVKERIKIRLLPDGRHILALLLSAAAVLLLSLVPSPVRDRAQLVHEVKEQAGEELADLEELLEALENVDTAQLSEEQRAQIEELTQALERSGEELMGAESWESLASATERLDYKYNQAGQSLENLSGQMTDPGAAGIASAEALARALSNEGKQMASSGTPSGGSGDGGNEGGSNKQGNSNGNGGDGGGNGENGNGGQGNGDGGQGSGGNGGQGNGDGGQGSGGNGGQGNGDGGQGNGTGGSGSGVGNGRGTGSSSTPHDYVSVPNALGNDSSLNGDKNGDQDSDYFRQQNGLAWEGEHVDYNSVIGRYMDNAYEGISKGRYPNGMESVIRNYFENLNK